VCPAGAISKDADSGIVLIDKTLCIGCKLCIDACPYDVPQFLEAELKVGKCDFCQDLLGIGENPVCVDSCPQFALEYGDINELKTKHSDAVTDLPLLPNSLQTGPSSIISPRPAMLDAKYSEKAI
jgi:anaerobic dimethyl sulfoxide reductase subunit B (iron-sulfur subunit)